MENLQQLSRFIQRMVSDKRLRPIHVALSTALCEVWIANGFQSSYHVSRSKLMVASKINSKATYHKVMRELQMFGYLEYTPSYHPTQASIITLKEETKSEGIDHAKEINIQ